MAGFGVNDWLVACGFGALWLGVQIVVVGRPPRALRRVVQPTAPKGTPEAFGLFWIDQYGFIGLTLAVGGALAAIAGLLR
ncbi:MAG: hypothetical protein FJ091_04715 [Deltaproteobacteria bacterium]|nr:hypothetical protein [Deltaproteobacteria bacterium]